jgi:hypothetical protein
MLLKYIYLVSLIQVIFNASRWAGSFIVSEDVMSEGHNIPTFLLNQNKSNKGEVLYTIQCFPIYSLLLAIGQTTVDYFSLDVEGSEYKILKTIPWHKVDIKVRTHSLFLKTNYTHTMLLSSSIKLNCQVVRKKLAEIMD